MIFQIPGSGDLKGHNIIAKPNIRHTASTATHMRLLNNTIN